jgi:hypothetical protein
MIEKSRMSKSLRISRLPFPGSTDSGLTNSGSTDSDSPVYVSPLFVRMLLCAVFLSIALAPIAAMGKVLKPGAVFLAAQRCRINGTVDFGCFQQKIGVFEQFVLKDDAGFVQKSIVAEALVKTYDAMHLESPTATAVRTKAQIYRKALEALDVSERGQIDDCKDESNPDGCLKDRYCFKEGYIKIKNILVSNHPELFQEEINGFDRQTRGNC